MYFLEKYFPSVEKAVRESGRLVITSPNIEYRREFSIRYKLSHPVFSDRPVRIYCISSVCMHESLWLLRIVFLRRGWDRVKILHLGIHT
jgi:hypothetical protein